MLNFAVRIIMKTLPFSLILIILLSLTSCWEQKKSGTEFNIAADTLQNDSLPSSTGAVTDNEGVFAKSEVDSLSKLCNRFFKEFQIPMQILTVHSIGNKGNFTEYADFIAEKWNICNKGQGLLFVFSVSLAEIRLITCPETEKILDGKTMDNIINGVIYPEFGREQYFNGISSAIAEISKHIAQKKK